MSTIRRLLSGISFSRTQLKVETEPVTPLTPGEPLQPVAPVRRGFSDQSDFQAEVDDIGASLAAHAPLLTGQASPTQGGAPSPEQLRVFSGESSFEPAPPPYARWLGSQLPSTLGAPGESSGGVGGLSAGRGRSGMSAPDMQDLLSPEAAAWELQNRDTSTPTLSTLTLEPEDLLSLLDSPGSASTLAPVVEPFEEGPGAASDAGGTRVAGFTGLDDAPQVPSELLDPAVRPAGPDEFLADMNDLGSMVLEEPPTGDAALATVPEPLAANPAADVPVSAALASQSEEAAADPFEVDLPTGLDTSVAEVSTPEAPPREG